MSFDLRAALHAGSVEGENIGLPRVREARRDGAGEGLVGPDGLKSCEVDRPGGGRGRQRGGSEAGEALDGARPHDALRTV